jgi:hypothetical protein
MIFIIYYLNFLIYIKNYIKQIMSRLNRVPLTRHQRRPRVVLTRPRPKPNSNSNSNTNTTNTNDYPDTINIQNIATQVPSDSSVWIINKDVTIGPTQSLSSDRTYTYITSYNFTNNGQFLNGGTFITTNSFTNNGKIGNNDAVFINTGKLVFNRNPQSIFNRGGIIINNGGTYSGLGIVLGNPVQTI